MKKLEFNNYMLFMKKILSHLTKNIGSEEFIVETIKDTNCAST